jgi:hypothetical protein
MNLQFDSFDSRGRRIKEKVLSISLISAYFPFCPFIDSMISTIGPSTQIIIMETSMRGLDSDIAMNKTKIHLDRTASHEVTRAVKTFSKF